MTSRGWGQLQSDSLPQFPLPGGKLPASGRVCGWDRELLHRFIRPNPRSRGGNLITEINCLFPRSVCAAERSSHRPPRGSRGQDGYPSARQGPKPGACRQEDPGPQDRLPSPLALPQGMGALGRMGDKLGQEQSESPPCKLPRALSTDRPPHWGPRQRCQRQAGRSTCVCKHTHTWVWRHRG